MRATTDVIEAGECSVAIRMTEVGRLLERRLHRKGVPIRRQELIAEGEGCPAPLHDDALSEAREPPVFQPGERTVAHAWLSLTPVITGTKVRHRKEDRDRFTPWRRHRWLGSRGRMNVHSVAARHAAIPRHVLDEAVIVIANYQRVVQQLLELPVRAEIHHVRGHRGAKWAQPPWEGVRQVREEGITCGDVAVVDHEVRVMHRSIGGANTGRSPIAMNDLINLAVD